MFPGVFLMIEVVFFEKMVFCYSPKVVKKAPKASKRKPSAYKGTVGLRLRGKSKSPERAFLQKKLRIARHLTVPFLLPRQIPPKT